MEQIKYNTLNFRGFNFPAKLFSKVLISDSVWLSKYTLCKTDIGPDKLRLELTLS